MNDFDKPLSKNIQTFIGCDAEYADSDIVLFGVPFDGTASFRPGSRFGPTAIRGESFGIETFSPYCDRELCDITVCDIGDIETPFGSAQRMLEMTERLCCRILRDGKLPFMLGGEHLITLGAVRAISSVYPELCVIHLDAHTDLREDYLGETLTHAGVIRQIWNLLGDGRIFQFGIRSGERSEFEFGRLHTGLHRFNLGGFEQTVKALGKRPVYFTLDLDVLDPSIMSGTGTTEAGGLTFNELMSAVSLLDELNIVGCDIVELAPHYDQSGVSTAVACKLTRELLLRINYNRT